jgi:hypothetical protein
MQCTSKTNTLRLIYPLISLLLIILSLAYYIRLVDNARKVVEADVANREELMKTSSIFSAITPDFQSDEDPIHPLDIIIDAWNQTCRERVTGSSTICVATLDNKLNQLSYSNLGDCGLVVMRHIDSETVGYMRERQTPRHLRKHDLRVAYLSQQQLRSFNLPYQLGFSDIPQHSGSFETPLDADTGGTHTHTHYYETCSLSDNY